MSSILSDPHNHAPEATPDDEWGDVEGLSSTITAPAILPPKRTKNETVPDGSEEDAPEGLRIESKVQARAIGNTEHQLEVHELAANVIRLDPVEPSVVKMPRQAVLHELPAGYSLTRPKVDVGVEWGRANKHSMRWILGISAGVGILIISAVMLLPRINRSNASNPGAIGLVMDPEEKVDGIEASNELLARQTEAEQIFRAYATARLPHDILPLVRDSKSLEPIILASHHSAMAPSDWTPPANVRWSVSSGDEHPFAVLEGSLPGFTKFCAYMILSKNRLRLDWKATTGYGTATFAELETNKGNPAEIRGSILPADFYTNVFPEAGFHSFQLVSPDNEKTVWCYTRRDQPSDAALARLIFHGEILESDTAPKKVTLRLQHAPAGSLPNQWLIDEILHAEWINLK